MNIKISGFSQEQLLEMDPEMLLAIIREKAHCSVEVPLYQAIYRGKKLPPNFGTSLRDLLVVWEKRMLPGERDDLKWCEALLEMASQVKEGSKLKLPVQGITYSKDQQQTIQQIIQSRRSVRVWQDKPVPESMIEQVLKAGLWAPHSCNLQTIRYIVLEGDAVKCLYQVKRLKGSPVCVIIAQDMRPYECFQVSIPPYNQFLECGAAVQNMLLSAHSLGLGAVWLTFEKGETEELRKLLNISGYLSLITYIALGWSAQGSLPPGRISVKEARIYLE